MFFNCIPLISKYITWYYIISKNEKISNHTVLYAAPKYLRNKKI